MIKHLFQYLKYISSILTRIFFGPPQVILMSTFIFCGHYGSWEYSRIRNCNKGRAILSPPPYLYVIDARFLVNINQIRSMFCHHSRNLTSGGRHFALSLLSLITQASELTPPPPNFFAKLYITLAEDLFLKKFFYLLVKVFDKPSPPFQFASDATVYLFLWIILTRTWTDFRLVVATCI